jgi:hypothetical protein
MKPRMPVNQKPLENSEKYFRNFGDVTFNYHYGATKGSQIINIAVDFYWEHDNVDETRSIYNMVNR